MSDETVTASAPGYLRRLGVWDASMIVVGGVIGWASSACRRRWPSRPDRGPNS